MSRVAKMPVDVPAGVDVQIANGEIAVKGPLGALVQRINPLVAIVREGQQLRVQAVGESRDAKALSGTFRALVANMVHGVSRGFEKKLQLVGTGYRAQAQGTALNLSLGFSHPIVYKLPDGITAAVTDDKKTHIVLTAANKELLGETAAKIRSFRPVNKDPYGLKGVRYSTEKPLQKEGKSGAK